MGEDVLDDDTITPTEKFVCQIFNTSEDSLESARVVLFDIVSSPERLQPTSDAFEQHLKRCHYQTAVWHQGL